LTVCTGFLGLAQTGVFDGYHVASNKMALKMAIDAGKLNRAVLWLGAARRVKDGMWSAAVVTAGYGGIDLAAEFARLWWLSLQR
jgi:NADH dehydrogenase FAD-containing subunit